jgi:hypothetical protein
MSDAHAHGAPVEPHDEGMDREIHVKTFVWFGVGLVGLTLLSLLAMWLMFRGFTRQAERRDPAPSPIQAANQRRLPPAPNLQTTPEKDLATVRAEEEARLGSYGWVDESQGIAHIPIARAMAILAERGATATTEVTPAPGTPTTPSPAPETTAPAAAPPGGPGSRH